MTKTIDTLVDDIYDLLKNGTDTLSEESLNDLGDSLKELMKRRLLSIEESHSKPTLRMSNIGKPLRQLYFDLKENAPREELEPHTLFKFIFGDVIELLFLFLAQASGHSVTGEQKEVVLNGVKGHIDAIIDDHLVDVKSTSTYAFKKFDENRLQEDDAFGYMKQLAGYAQSEELKDKIKGAGFAAVSKELGKMTYMPVDLQELEMEHPSEKIDLIREALAKDTPPEKCYEPEPMGASGNLKLGIGCSYCAFKERCWSDANNGKGLRTFLYSNKPEFLVKVVKEPKVPELK